MPEKINSQFDLSVDHLRRDTILKGESEIKDRLKRLYTVLGGMPEGRYVLQQDIVNLTYPDSAGRNFDVARTSNLRYLLENQNVSMQHWYSAFNFNRPSYIGFQVLAALEKLAWKKLLDPDYDADLYRIYERKYLADKSGLPGGIFYKTPDEKDICESLKTKSLITLN